MLLRSRFQSLPFLVLSALLVSLSFSTLLACWQGPPPPDVHDEFAYLLGADTFAHGRVTNPTHPMWEHFESLHIIQQPSYAPKYPPAQALSLALGQWIAHPFLGVILMTGVSVAALVWMLTGWLEQSAWPVAWCCAVLHPGLYLLWGNSYWGGAVALTGSALLLGSYIRSLEHPRWEFGLVGGIGILLLANSRPFEGAVLTTTVGLAVALGMSRRDRQSIFDYARMIVMPAAGCLVIGMAAMLFYNLKVTGSPSTMPYQVYEQTYGWNPLFLWQAPGESPEYRHAAIENVYREDVTATDEAYATLASTLSVKGKAAFGMLEFMAGPILLLTLIGLPGLWKRLHWRMALFMAIPPLLAALASKWANLHYAAPAMPLVLATGIAGALLGGHWLSQRLRSGKLVVASALGLQLIWMIAVADQSLERKQHSWGWQRSKIAQQLQSLPGRDLVLVRYQDGHNPCEEWVYNRADIDGSEIVWAREMSATKRQQLLEYFGDRQVWILEPDQEPLQLRPFDDSREAQPNSLSAADQPSGTFR